MTIDINNAQGALVSAAREYSAKRPELERLQLQPTLARQTEEQGKSGTTNKINFKSQEDKELQIKVANLGKEVTDLLDRIAGKTKYLSNYYGVSDFEKYYVNEKTFEDAYKQGKFNIPPRILSEMETKYRDALTLAAILAGVIAASLGGYLAYQSWLDRKKPETIPSNVARSPGLTRQV